MECFNFLLETTRSGCNAEHHIGTVTSCLQQISKVIAKTNVQKSNVAFKSQDSEEPSGPLVSCHFISSILFIAQAHPFAFIGYLTSLGLQIP